MSHLVTFYLSGQKIEINSTCDTSINTLKRALQENYDDEFKQYLQEEINKIHNYKQELSLIPNATSDRAVLQQLDHISKTTANIISSISNAEYFEKKDKELNDLIRNYVKEYGVIATEALQNLKEQKIDLNKTSLSEEIDKIRNNNLQEEKIKKNIDSLYKFIDDQKFDNSDLSYELKTIIRNYKSPQEFSDAFAYIASKKVEVNKIEIIKEDLFEGLKLGGFKSFDLKKTSINEYGITYKVFKAKNLNGNVVTVIISGDGSIKYQLGNYVGHACEKTTEKLLDYLKKQGVAINHYVVTREISNAKPLYQAKKSFNK